MSLSSRLCLLAALLLTGHCAAGFAGEVTERLEYRVSYRGVFSLGNDVSIADLTLETRTLPGEAGLMESRLEADSQAYPTVEAVYPIRYRFRTWLTPGANALVAFETLEEGRKKRHRLYLRNDSPLGVHAFNVTGGAGQDEIARLDAGEMPDQGGLHELLFDRLGLLQKVRRQELHEDAEFRFPVTNGRERLDYRVRVEGAELLPLGGLVVPAWKVRFDGFGTREDGSERPSHRPIYIWLSQSVDKVPLRADSQHPVGLFRIELHPPSALKHLAMAGG